MRLETTRELRMLREDLRSLVVQSNQARPDAASNNNTSATTTTGPAMTEQTPAKVPLFGKSPAGKEDAEEKKEAVVISDLLDLELDEAAR